MLWKPVLALLLLLLPCALPAQAAEDNGPILWTDPGRAPFRGSLEEAVALMRQSRYVDQRVLSELLAKRNRGEAPIPVMLRGHQILVMTFTSTYTHNHELALMQVPAGGMAPDATSEAVAYLHPSGAALMRPLVCGNWSYVPVQPGPPVLHAALPLTFIAGDFLTPYGSTPPRLSPFPYEYVEPPTPVPEPPTIVLFIIMTGLLYGVSRRRPG